MLRTWRRWERKNPSFNAISLLRPVFLEFTTLQILRQPRLTRLLINHLPLATSPNFRRHLSKLAHHQYMSILFSHFSVLDLPLTIHRFLVPRLWDFASKFAILTLVLNILRRWLLILCHEVLG